MDIQLSYMHKLNSESEDLVYKHIGETISYRKVKDENGNVTIVEIRFNHKTGNETVRTLLPYEMTETQFNIAKAEMNDNMHEAVKLEYQQTYKNYSYDLLSESTLIYSNSPETLLLKKEENKNSITQNNPRTTANAMKILDECLSEKHKQWYLMFYRDGKSAREIARIYGVAHTTVSRALEAMNKKIKKFL